MIKIENWEIKPTIFPDKTSQIWKLPEDLIDYIKSANRVEVTWQFESEAELVWMCQLSTLILGVSRKIPSLNCPYLPYARQDKQVKNDQCFALHTVLSTLSGYFECIKTFDAHNIEPIKRYFADSEITNELPHKQIGDIRTSEAIDLIVYPDAGAHERYHHLSAGVHTIIAEKHRDQLTGAITSHGLSLTKEIVPKLNGANVLIIDDICDGGATFMSLASMLHEYPINKLVLYVSHGIFSRGTKVLLNAGINKIYTKDGLVAC